MAFIWLSWRTTTSSGFLWATGSSLPSLWITPVIIFVVWIAIQLGLKSRHRHYGA
jgi:hypothetical protein